MQERHAKMEGTYFKKKLVQCLLMACRLFDDVSIVEKRNEKILRFPICPQKIETCVGRVGLIPWFCTTIVLKDRVVPDEIVGVKDW